VRREGPARFKKRLVALSWLFSLATAATSRAALAEEPSAKDRTTARALAIQGYEALRVQDYALSADRFKRADALVHAPTLLVDLARSYLGLGRMVDAHEAYQQVLREGVAPGAPPSWKRALADAEKEDAALAPRLAWVTVRIEGAKQAHVKLDGEVLSSASLGVRRAVDPGRRDLLAEAEGFLPARSVVELREGETGEVRLVLEPDPRYKPHLPQPPAKPRKEKEVILVERSAPRQRTAAYVAYGVSSAGLLLGGVSTFLMLRARSDLQFNPRGEVTLSSADEYSKYQTYGWLAGAGLGVGLVGAGIGTYALLSANGKDATERRYAVNAQVSPGYVGLRGSF
jgi:hypothetical protein